MSQRDNPSLLDRRYSRKATYGAADALFYAADAEGYIGAPAQDGHAPLIVVREVAQADIVNIPIDDKAEIPTMSKLIVFALVGGLFAASVALVARRSCQVVRRGFSTGTDLPSSVPRKRRL